MSICMSLCSSAGLVCVFNSFNTRYDYYYFYYYQCGVPALRYIYMHTGFPRTPVGSSQVYVSVYLSLCLSLCLVVRVAFWRSEHVDHNCVQRIQSRDTGSNPLSGSIICPPVRLIVCGNFEIFVFLLVSVWGSSAAIYLSPYWGPKNPSGVHLRWCVSFSVFLCVYRVEHVTFWKTFTCPVFVRSLCGRRPWGWCTSRFKIYTYYMFLTMFLLTSLSTYILRRQEQTPWRKTPLAV